MLNILLYNMALLTFIIYFYKKTRHGLHMLQLESYKNERYRKWVKINKTIDIKEIILLLLVNILIYIGFETIGIILINIIFIIYTIIRNQRQEKKPFVVTARIKRMYITYIIILVILAIFMQINYKIAITVISILAILSYKIVEIINIINSPIEKQIQKKYYNKAKNKLEQVKDLKIIGITGSYGKTSTKYIISTILSQKYQVLMTPESYNTTMGVVRTINENLKSTTQVFVCEMGAKNIGDIKEICDLVKPNIGVLTAIGPQHLETFKTIQNVQKTKLELIDSLPQQGIAFLNNEDENIRKAIINKNKITFGIAEDSDYYAKNLKITEKGSEFEIVLKNKEKIEIKTKLLGKHNIINIVGAVAVAYEMGLNLQEIKKGIYYIKPVPHRLQLKQNINGSIIIDDAYNSNIKGAQMAFEVLASFKDKKKILITPGIVDAGDKQEQINEQLGEFAAKSADYIILVGQKQAVPIKKGLEKQKYPQDKIYIAKDIKDAIIQMNKIMDENTVTLLENDLPDNYI